MPSVELPPCTPTEDPTKVDASGSDSDISDASDSESEHDSGDSDKEGVDADSGDEADESEVSDADDAGVDENDLAQALGALLNEELVAADDVLEDMLNKSSKEEAMKFAGKVYDNLSVNEENGLINK